jgi:hypothetical protein
LAFFSVSFSPTHPVSLLFVLAWGSARPAVFLLVGYNSDKQSLLITIEGKSDPKDKISFFGHFNL